MAKVTGVARAKQRLEALRGEKAIRLIGQALFAGGEILRAEASHLITEGAVSGKGHVPSRPGDPPNEDTGVLRSHINTYRTGPLRVEVASEAPYAVPLETGTSKMRPRPYMGPATRRTRKQIVELVGKAISRATKEA